MLLFVRKNGVTSFRPNNIGTTYYRKNKSTRLDWNLEMRQKYQDTLT